MSNMSFYLSLFFFILLCSFAISWISMAPWVPTRSKDLRRCISVLGLKKGDIFLEIWSGDGRVSRTIAKAFPESKIVGIEMTFPLFLYTYLGNIFFPLRNLTFVFWNAFKQDFGDYDAIYVYGMPDKMSQKIVPKFMKEAKNGTKLYSYVFSIPEEYREWVVSHWGENQAKIHVLEKK